MCLQVIFALRLFVSMCLQVTNGADLLRYTFMANMVRTGALEASNMLFAMSRVDSVYDELKELSDIFNKINNLSFVGERSGGIGVIGVGR